MKNGDKFDLWLIAASVLAFAAATALTVMGWTERFG